MTIPLQVMKYAKVDGGNPFSWHEDQEKWVIVYYDGRKIVHMKTKGSGIDRPQVENTKAKSHRGAADGRNRRPKKAPIATNNETAEPS